MAQLIYDFETTGFFNKESLYHESQPHVVQLAAILASPTGETIASIDLIAKPNGWTIPERASDVHGITTEFALTHGISEHILITCLSALSRQADIRIAHNEQFDNKIMRIGLARFSLNEELGLWEISKVFCTANAATPVMKLPPTARMQQYGHGHEFKKPNLAEAYLAATGEELIDAHSAMPDVLACKAVYEWLQKENSNG